MGECKPLSWLRTAPAHREILYTAMDMAGAAYIVAGRGEVVLSSGWVTREGKATITQALAGLAAAHGATDMRVDGMLVDATPEGREWQLEQALRSVVLHITSGGHYETRNPYSRPCVAQANALLESLHGRMPSPPFGVLLADIKFKGDKV